MVALVRADSKREDIETWAIPGGKIDPGENAVKAATREFFEECLKKNAEGMFMQRLHHEKHV